jgi:hypothetical protein
MNPTNQRKLGRLIFKLLLVAVMFASLLFPSSRLTPVQADGWNECDDTYIGGAVPDCISGYNQCLNNCSDEPCRNACLTSYQNCLAGAYDSRNTCWAGIQPVQLPVNDDRWQMCIAACTGCDDINGGGDPFSCYADCRHNCSALYPRP